jgi:SpoVK/Ycf46/Vps4 family AAA+-type ATPase
MLQQLQQEMDGLPRGELVLVVGTSRSRTDLDPALFRPGRFELVLEVSAPDAADRRDILRRLDRDLDLRLTPEALDRAVELGAGGPDAPPYHGERLHALGRALARRRLREGQAGPTTPAEVEAALALL